MNLELDQLSSHYKHSSRRFLFYRISIAGSMLMLMAVLGINLYFLNSGETTNLKSHASNDEKPPLPSLPQGCEYKKSANGYVVSCEKLSPTIVPSPSASPLPPNCRYENISEKEYVIRCDTSAGVPNIQPASAGANLYPSPTPRK